MNPCVFGCGLDPVGTFWMVHLRAPFFMVCPVAGANNHFTVNRRCDVLIAEPIPDFNTNLKLVIDAIPKLIRHHEMWDRWSGDEWFVRHHDGIVVPSFLRIYHYTKQSGVLDLRNYLKPLYNPIEADGSMGERVAWNGSQWRPTIRGDVPSPELYAPAQGQVIPILSRWMAPLVPRSKRVPVVVAPSVEEASLLEMACHI